MIDNIYNPNDFCIFIISYQRANNVKTYKTLQKCNCKYPIFIVVSDDDTQINQYKKNFSENNLVIYSKREYIGKFDYMDNRIDKLSSAVFSRNAVFDIAKKLGYPFFLVLDDDYGNFQYRYMQNNKLRGKILHKSLDKILYLYKETLKALPNIHSLAMSQAGDFIGGNMTRAFSYRRLRKIMNVFFCATDRRFEFFGRLNEDVNVYTKLGNIGYLFLTIPEISIVQLITQRNEGGLTSSYLELGTYIKTFYTLLAMPSSVKIGIIQDTFSRIHHQINWKFTIPYILPDEVKKYKK
mgnify:FL=1